MKKIYKHFSQLLPKQVEDIFSLRQQVFIIEQQCFYNDIDGEDGQAYHLMMYDEETLAAYLRIFKPGTKYPNEASMGRIVVDPSYRKTGLGVQLIRKGIELCDGVPIYIEAQAALENYYYQFGFKTISGVYVVDGIKHIKMKLG